MTATRRNLVILCLAYGLAAVLMLHQTGIDLAAGGSDWRQGEWLINVERTAIRRGLLGSGLIALSDATGVGLLALTVAVPMALLGLILVSLVAFAVAEGPGDRLLLLLLSPGFVLFWGADPESILRKEVLIYAAFLPLILVAGRGQGGRWALAASVALFALAAAGHEMSIFFVPALAAAILTCRPRDAASWVAVTAVAVLGLLTFGFALRYPTVPDIALVCDPLMARGLSPAICEGAISWVRRDIDFAQERLLVQADNPRAWTVVLAYGASLLPFVVVLWRRRDAGRGLGLLLLAGLPFLPLWVVALDWGRWVNAHVAVMVFLVLILLRTGRLPGFSDPLPRLIYLATLAVCLGVGMRHVGGSIRAGLIEVALRTFVHPSL
jgi:hypothetical protein